MIVWLIDDGCEWVVTNVMMDVYDYEDCIEYCVSDGSHPDS